MAAGAFTLSLALSSCLKERGSPDTFSIEGGPEATVHIAEGSLLPLFIPGPVVLLEDGDKAVLFQGMLSRGPKVVAACAEADQICLGDWKGTGPVEIRIASSSRNPSSGLRCQGEAMPLDLPGPLAIEVDEGNGRKSKRFRGSFVLTRKGENLILENRLSLEEYLAGVVGREMSASACPLEALKAQAVAARTYALYGLLLAAQKQGRAPRFAADESFQVYGGIAGEHPRALEAVVQTRGEVLTFRGGLFRAYYHSTCGGRTADGASVFSEPAIEPFESAECGACDGARFARWEARFLPEEIGAALRAWAASRRVELGAIEGLEVVETTPDGRARYVRVRHGRGSMEVQAERLRTLLQAQGGAVPRSTAFTIAKDGEEFLLQGRGWGHGVGLCQVGARRKGEKESYRQILKDYYRGSDVEKLY